MIWFVNTGIPDIKLDESQSKRQQPTPLPETEPLSWTYGQLTLTGRRSSSGVRSPATASVAAVSFDYHQALCQLCHCIQSKRCLLSAQRQYCIPEEKRTVAAERSQSNA